MKKKFIAILLTMGMITSGMQVMSYGQDAGNADNTVYAATTGTAASGSAVGIEEQVVAPAAPLITQIKGGSKRVKLYWNKVSGASGYYIYYSTEENGTFSRIKTITSPSTVKYVKKSLEQNVTYYFKISSYVTKADGTRVEGETSPVYSATTVASIATSKAARKYSTLTNFKKSPAYKKYPILRKATYSSKSFAIPGMKNTNVAGFNNNRMFPQGACAAGAYMLVSAYAYNGEDESVIYILSRSSKSYITTLVMPNKTKLNAVAYDGKNIWVTQGKKISYFSYEEISKAVAAGTSFTELSACEGTYPIATTGSCMAYRDGMLWIGAYNATQVTRMYGYALGTDAAGKPTVIQKQYMTIPNRTRAVSFDDEGYMYITRSRQSNNKQTGYLSQVRVYKPNFSTPAASGSVKKNSYVKKVTLPPRATGSMVYGEYLYTVFSGCKYSKCSYKVDRVIAVKRSLMR